MDTGNLESGESYRFVLTVAGTYPYIDERNDDQTAYHGRIVVRAPATGGPDAEAITVRIGDEVFSPAAVTVAVGGQVTFENLDGDDHTATSTDGGPLASPVLAIGESYAATFPEPGTFSYLCAIHPEMTGTVEVVGEAPPAPVAPATPATLETPTPDTGEAPPGSSTTIGIEMQDFAFDASDVEIEAGTTVIWSNTGAAPHTATAGDDSFDTTLVAAGGEASHTFSTPGTYDYLCIFHPGMAGTIRVSGAATTIDPAAAAAAAPTPSASPLASGEPPIGQAEPAATIDEGAVAVVDAAERPSDPATTASLDPAPAASTTVDGLARLAIVLAIVSTAGALFARAIQGTVRHAD